MADAPRWPPYPIGPKDSIFALGVASCKFTELEGVLAFMFATVFDLKADAGQMIVSKIGNEAAVELVQRQSQIAKWLQSPEIPKSTTSLIEHFTKGFSACLENRNHLMHSTFAWYAPSVLIKTTKKGDTQIALPALNALRKVADDMDAFCAFGRSLANAINDHKEVISGFRIGGFPWPDKPPPPHKLRYSSSHRAE